LTSFKVPALSEVSVPTLITHSMLGIVASKAVANGEMSARFAALSVFCSVVPDADIIAFFFGIPYGHPLGHRGFFHSLSFAFVLACCVVVIFIDAEKVFSGQWWLLVLYFFLVTASHGLLDACTNGGMGIALLAPFDHTRFFFPRTPIVVSPISIQAFASPWGLRVVVSELLWVWLPTFCVLGLLRWGVRPDFFPRV
jgi:inner membrane protein